MILLDLSIVSVALPPIERDLHASARTVQWVVSGYSLALGLVLVAAGRLGDTFGRRRMFLIALSAFVLTSALTGAAPTMGLLIAALLVQGVAGGMLMPQNSGLGRWWPLFGVAGLLLAAFVWWELRTVRRGRQPLLQPRLAHTPGYLAGSGIALIYFMGFTGIWLVMALFLQDGLGY